ncbi:MAG: phosphatase PAP2-related protein [Patescibacteria group bacterium]
MQHYKEYFSNKSFVISFILGVLALVVSYMAQFYSSLYATSMSSSPVTDIILSNTRVYDVDGIFVYGSVALVLLVLCIGLTRLNYAPFIMKSVALFTFIRSIFISLTHVSPFPTHVIISSDFFRDRLFYGIFTGNDLFFSGHTGVPFLLALIFWEHKILRIVFLCFSGIFAVVVLLGHLHYSIDVLAAFFISYSIYEISNKFFKKDKELFLKKVV